MKRLLSILLSLAMILLLAAGCATTPSIDGDVSDSGASADDGTEAPTAEKVVLTLGNWPEDTQETEIAMFEEWKKTFEGTHPNVEVVPAYYFYALDTFVPMAESGQCPTLFQPWYTETDKLVNGGFVADMTDYLEERGWLQVMNPSIKEVITRDGRTYGMPRDGYALGLMMNLELFEEAGLVENGLPNYPKTWDELATTAQTIKQKTGQGGFCLLAENEAGGWHFSNIAWAFGADLILADADGGQTANVNTPEAIAA
ncbi:MAG: ABC transporter substrate-binding protein, partial [Acetanaerobacterium sp.]